MKLQVCSSNPCRHGGTCWSSVDSFYCACRPGYTGKTCAQQIMEDVQSSRETELQEQTEEFSSQSVPIAVRLDKLHNIYIAAGTLACALLIVVLTVRIQGIPNVRLKKYFAKTRGKKKKKSNIPKNFREIKYNCLIVFFDFFGH